MRKWFILCINAFFLFPIFSNDWNKAIHIGLSAPISNVSVSWDDFGNLSIIDSDLDGTGIDFNFQLRSVNSSNIALMLDYNLGFSKINFTDTDYQFSLNGLSETVLFGIGYRVFHSKRFEAIISAVQGLSTFIVFGSETIDNYDIDYRFIMNNFNFGGDIYFSFAFSEKLLLYFSGMTFITLAGTASMKESIENFSTTLIGNPETGGISFIPHVGIVLRI